MNRRHPILAAYDAVDRALVRKGFPATSEWWLQTFERFYTSSVRQCVLRVGRRGGKSSSLCRVAVTEALYGEHTIPPGDVGIVAIVSANRGQANDRIKTVKSILDALGIGHHPVEAGVELDDRPIAFKVYTASVSSVVSFSCVCAIADELAYWADAETGSNPAREVMANLRPTLTGQKAAKIFLSSSPLLTLDYHARTFDEGDNQFQRVFYAPTWIARPSLPESECRADEPDERLFRRSYEAIPSASTSTVFSAELLDAAFAKRERPLQALSAPIVVCDPSNNMIDHGDDFSFGLAWWGRQAVNENEVFLWEDGIHPQTGQIVTNGKRRTDAGGHPLLNPDYKGPGEPVLCITDLGIFDRGLGSTDVVRHLVELAKSVGAIHIVADHRDGFTLAGLCHTLSGGRVAWHPIDWTNKSKESSVRAISRLLRERKIVFSGAPDEAARLRGQMIGFTEKFTASGAITFGGKGSASDDMVSLVLNAWLAEEARLIRGSPHAVRNARRVTTKKRFGPF